MLKRKKFLLSLFCCCAVLLLPLNANAWDASIDSDYLGKANELDFYNYYYPTLEPFSLGYCGGFAMVNGLMGVQNIADNPNYVFFTEAPSTIVDWDGDGYVGNSGDLVLQSMVDTAVDVSQCSGCEGLTPEEFLTSKTDFIEGSLSPEAFSNFQIFAEYDPSALWFKQQLDNNFMVDILLGEGSGGEPTSLDPHFSNLIGISNFPDAGPGPGPPPLQGEDPPGSCEECPTGTIQDTYGTSPPFILETDIWVLDNQLYIDYIPYGFEGSHYIGTLDGVAMPISYAVSQAVPEPASLILLGTGLFGIGIGSRRKKRK